MDRQKGKLTAILSWLLPSGTGLVITSAFCVMTLAISNASFLGSIVFIPNGFRLGTAMLDTVNDFVVQLVGDQIARSAVVAIFWAFVGLFVYILIWLALNFSSELGNDLAITRYIHPKNVDTSTPLRSFFSRISFQIITLFVFIFYSGILVGTLMPYFGGIFRLSINKWFSVQSIRLSVVGLLSELLAIHLWIILIRALMLRKRVFG